MTSDKKKLLLVAAVMFLGLIVLLTILFRGDKQQNIEGTGGDYAPYPTQVVFRNSDNLYASFRSEELDNLQDQLAKRVNSIYGKGSFTAYVVDDKLNFLAPGDYNIPSYWFEVRFDKIPLRLKVTTNFDGTSTSFKLITLNQ